MPIQQKSTEYFYQEIEQLKLKVEELEREKNTLNRLINNITYHAENLEEVLHETSVELYEIKYKLASESTKKQQLKALLETIKKEKEDLEILLEMTTLHGDLIQDILHNKSIRDPLTGLFNRSYMQECLNRELGYISTLGIILIDLDYFKKINDNFGHQAGDFVLQEVSKFLIENTRSSDIVCRYGGEELIIILPKANLQITQMKAEKLREGVKNLNLQYREKPLGKVTISIGVASFPNHGDSIISLIKAADQALYCAKGNGRDQVVTATI
jgi:diguanylate cyclase (GGDEF)-like protein